LSDTGLKRERQAALATTTDDGGRVPPHDIAAEQCAVGGMMLSKDAIADVTGVIGPAAHYRPAHQIIHEAILALYSRGEPADAITVADLLTTTGQITKIGGAGYLHTCIAAVPSAAQAGYYARIVAGKAILRQLTETGARIAQYGWDGEGDPADLVNRAQADTYALTDRRTASEHLPLAELMPPALDELEAIAGNGGPSGVPTGFADLDALTHGLHPGQLVILGARPAIGKSTLALDAARHAAIRHGMCSLIFSLEMGRLEIAMRILSAEAKVALHAMRGGRLNDDDWTRLARRMGEISDAPLWVDDSPATTLAEIRAKCRMMKQARDLKFVVVDYLQLMSSPAGKRTENRAQEVGELSRGLKLLAKELEVPILALSQLNRGPEQRQDKKPQLSDLRESGGIEQDSDVVILLHREDAHEREHPRAGEADLIVAKHRNGPVATVTVAFQGHYSRFVDMAPPA
jgi:replicative DNA helicase